MGERNVLRSFSQPRQQVVEEMLSLYEACQDMIILYDDKGNVLGFNSQVRQILKYDKKDTSLTIRDIFDKIYRNDQNGVSVLHSYEERMEETVAYSGNGSCIPVSVKVSYIETGGEIIGVCTAHSLVEYKKIEYQYKIACEQLELMEQNQGDFLANITHELKTPLNGIAGAARSLVTEQGEIDQDENLEIITSCCENMSRLITMILDYSALSAGNAVLEEERFDFRKMVDEIEKVHRGLLADKNLRFRVSIAEGTPRYMIGDYNKVKSIFMNLLSNAIKFTQIGFVTLDILTISVTKENVQLLISVMDTGIGISKEEQDKLFKRFSQVDGSIKRKFGGTGLGLSITKNLVELMGGSIRVESEKGRGTVFTCIIKLKPDPADNVQEEYVGIPSDHKELQIEDEYLRNWMNTNDDEVEGEFSYYYIMQVKEYGTPENCQEIERNIERMEICMRLDQWDRCETFISALKILIPEDQTEPRKILFKTELAVRRGDFTKANAMIIQLKNQIYGVE